MKVNDDLVDELVSRGTIPTQRLVQYLERAHRTEPGVAMETLETYADALSDRRDYDFDAEAFLEAIDAELVESDTWAGEDALYTLANGHVSRYPPTWHDELGGSDDVAGYVAYLGANATEFVETVGGYGAGGGIDEMVLLDVVATVGRIPRPTAKAELERLRDEGVLVEDADQHPHAGVYLASDDDDRRDSALEP